MKPGFIQQSPAPLPAAPAPSRSAGAHLKHAGLKGAASLLHKAGYISADKHAEIVKHTNLHMKNTKRK